MHDMSRAGARNAFYVGDVVVALEHADAVALTLQRLGVGFEEADRHPGLGLALLRLADEAAAADTLERELRREDGPVEAAGAPDATAMDRVLRALRQLFAHRYAGWSPTVGKNRLVGQVVGGGKISHGGGPDPVPTDRRLSVREAGPGRGVRVGVLDTSISAHPWLSGGWVAAPASVLGEDAPAGGDARAAVAGHATFVAGLVLSQAPGCVVEARQVLSDGDGAADSWTVAREIVELGAAGLDVLNLSFVCFTEDGRAPMALAAAVDRLDPRTVVVAAAGNHGDLEREETPGDRRKPAWPAALDHVVATGAADGEGRAAAFTPADVPWVDVLAPGVDVVSTFLHGPVRLGAAGGSDPADFGGWATWSGTSFAAGLLSGAIAAGTVPGRVPARQAWHDLQRGARPGADGGPGFLPLG